MRNNNFGEALVFQPISSALQKRGFDSHCLLKIRVLKQLISLNQTRALPESTFQLFMFSAREDVGTQKTFMQSNTLEE
jgi:hypothetical protein